jgi:hypothetical protein
VSLLLTERDAFFIDHHKCGDLDAGLDRPVFWIACGVRASLARHAALAPQSSRHAG